MDKQRARNQKDKEARREQFMRAALDEFSDSSFSDVTMSAVARRAGMAKGTLYLYFGSKEELFLQALVAELVDWFGEIGDWLEVAGRAEADELAGFIARSLIGRPDMTELLSIVHIVLEQNLDEDVARKFEVLMRDNLSEAGEMLERALDGLAQGDGLRLFLQMHAIVVGLFQVANPAQVVADILEEPGMEMMQIDFESELEHMLTSLLVGFTRRG
jgi:AcrR family transcriptional regulator